MQVNITYRNMFATDALRSHVEQKLAHMVSKYLDKVTEVHVTLSLERYLHHADINLHAGPFHVRGKEKSEDMYASIDLAMDKIERQLKRYKEKLKTHHGRERVHHNQNLVRHHIYEGHGSVAELAEAATQKIVKTNEFLAHPMGMEEAIMQMDLMNNDFYVFTNSTTMEMNVVYHRKDGTIGLIEASAVQKRSLVG